jgi:hypothetical protein
MKILLTTAILIALGTPHAHAQFLATPDNGGFDLTCTPSISVSKQDRNPVVGIHIFGHLAKGGQHESIRLRDIEVEQKMMNGAHYFRSRQYTIAATLGTVPTEDTEIFAVAWSGTWNLHPNVNMTGRLRFYKTGAVYVENQTRNGVHEFTTMTGCRYSGDDNEGDSEGRVEYK